MVSRDTPLMLIIIMIVLMTILTAWVGISMVGQIGGGRIGKIVEEVREGLPIEAGMLKAGRAMSDREEEEAAAAAPVMVRKEGVMVPETLRMIDYPVVGIRK